MIRRPCTTPWKKAYDTRDDAEHPRRLTRRTPHVTTTAPDRDTERELRLTIVVHGRPAPQGSKRYAGHRRNSSSGRISAVLVEQSRRVKPWRALVTAATVDAINTGGTGYQPLDGPLEAEIIFTVRKPASAPKRRRTWPVTRDSGDLDKLLRSTFDGIADGQAVVDDSRIIRVTATKAFPLEHPEALPEPGAIIRLYTLPGDAR